MWYFRCESKLGMIGEVLRLCSEDNRHDGKDHEGKVVGTGLKVDEDVLSQL